MRTLYKTSQFNASATQTINRHTVQYTLYFMEFHSCRTDTSQSITLPYLGQRTLQLFVLVYFFNVKSNPHGLRSDIIIFNKKKKKKKICKIVDFAVPADHRIKLKEHEKRDKYLDLARELKKTMEHEGDNYTNREWCLWHGN